MRQINWNEIAERSGNGGDFIEATRELGVEDYIDVLAREYRLERLNHSDVNPLIELVDALGLYDDLADIIEVLGNDQLDDYVETILAPAGWQTTAIALSEIKWFSDDYFYIDAYGHVNNVDNTVLTNVLDDLAPAVLEVIEETIEDMKGADDDE